MLELREVVGDHHAFAGGSLAVHLVRVAGHRRQLRRPGDAVHFHRDQHHRRLAKHDPCVADHLHALDARDRRLFLKYWNDDSVNIFRVYVKPGAPIAEVRQRILEQYAGQRQVFVLTNDELKRYILKVTDQWFGLTSVQIAVAVLVAILGIVNTLTVSITDRRRELGVLQAVGGLHRQIRGTIWIEALSIGTLGLVLGFALGAINLYYILQIVHHDIAGMRLDYVFPISTVFALVPTILGAAFVAAIWPAESAVHGSLVEALEYE